MGNRRATIRRVPTRSPTLTDKPRMRGSPPTPDPRSALRRKRRNSAQCVALTAGYATFLWFGLPALGFGLGEGPTVVFIASILLAVIAAMSWLAAEIEHLVARLRGRPRKADGLR